MLIFLQTGPKGQGVFGWPLRYMKDCKKVRPSSAAKGELICRPSHA